jgi:hypothetical protein
MSINYETLCTYNNNAYILLNNYLYNSGNDENMLTLTDLVSILVVVGSYAIIALKIRSELRNP